jgi:uncharacterized membrane protein (DUF485 family)
MQRFIGVILGGLTTFVLLNLSTAMAGDQQVKYAVPIIIGVIVALLWPWIIGIILVRRAKARRDKQIEKEVDKRMAGG